MVSHVRPQSAQYLRRTIETIGRHHRRPTASTTPELGRQSAARRARCCRDVPSTRDVAASRRPVHGRHRRRRRRDRARQVGRRHQDRRPGSSAVRQGAPLLRRGRRRACPLGDPENTRAVRVTHQRFQLRYTNKQGYGTRHAAGSRASGGGHDQTHNQHTDRRRAPRSCDADRGIESPAPGCRGDAKEVRRPVRAPGRAGGCP